MPTRVASVLLSLLAAGSFAHLAMPSAAVAAPVRPGATPMLLSGALPTTCPSAADLDGSTFTRRARSVLPTTRLGLVILGLRGLDAVAKPAITICDPDAAAARRLIGAFGGETAHVLNADVVGFGLRSIGAENGHFERSILQPGDRVTLPSVGERAQLDLSVATNGGARSVRIAPLGAGATAVRIEGSAAAPSVVVEHGETAAAPVRVTAQPVVKRRVSVRVRGRTVTFAATAAPGTILIAVSNRQSAESTVGLGVASTENRVAGLPLRWLRRSNREAELAFFDLPRRQVARYRCALRWAARQDRIRSVRCKTVPIDDATASRLARPQAPQLAAPAPRATGARTHPPRAARQLRAEVSTATVATIATDKTAWNEYALVGDLNGDHRPDGLSTDADTGRTRLLVSAGSAWTAVPVRFPVDDFYTLDSIPEVVADVTGDGRAELRTEDGRFVTDAFASALPTVVDLRARRAARPGDLDLGGRSPSDKTRRWGPAGTLADRTGDGRPEPVLRYGRATAVFASQDVLTGRVNQLTTPYPLTIGGTVALRLGDVELDDGPSDDGPFLGPPDRTSLVVSGQLTTLEAVQLTASAEQPRELLLRRRDADGNAISTARVLMRGAIRLVDVDPATGDTLVASGPAECEAEHDEPCLDRVTRLDARGGTVSVVKVEGLGSGTFVADGPDLDTRADAVLWTSGSDDRTPDFAYVPSTTTGPSSPRRLPSLTRNGAPLKMAGETRAIMLADGSRWLGTTVDLSSDGTAGAAFVLLAPTP